MPGMVHSHTHITGGRALAVIATALVTLAVVATLALVSGGGEPATAPEPAVQRIAAPAAAAPGLRYDGGPEEGSRGAGTSSLANPGRPDGGPEEGTRGPGH